MAATRIVYGALREIWRESAHQGNIAQTIPTDIRISTQQLSRVRALITLDAATGAPVVTATAAISAGGFLQIIFTNSAPDTTVDWTLDVELTHSVQQRRDPDPTHGAVIMIVNGAGVGGIASSQNLAQTYDFGAIAPHQTMTISTAKGGGVLVDASTGAVAGSLVAFEVRQSVAHVTPMALTRCGDDALAALLQYMKSRGTWAAPAKVNTDDSLGDIDWYGYYGGVFQHACRIEGICTNADENFGAALDFYASAAAGALGSKLWRMEGSAGATAWLTGYGTNPVVDPDTDHTGSVGETGHIWLAAHIDTVNAHVNVLLGGASIVGGANHTVLLPNDATVPVTPANQTYLGSNDHGGATGVDGAVLAIGAEKAAIAGNPPAADCTIPIRYNGAPYLLLAYDDTPV